MLKMMATAGLVVCCVLSMVSPSAIAAPLGDSMSLSPGVAWDVGGSLRLRYEWKQYSTRFITTMRHYFLLQMTISRVGHQASKILVLWVLCMLSGAIRAKTNPDALFIVDMPVLQSVRQV